MMNEKHKNECITAEELMKQLSVDSNYQRRKAEKEKRRLIEVEANKKAAKLILNDLESIGVGVSSIRELIESYSPLSPDIVDILIKWISRIERIDIQDAVIRALCTSRKDYDGQPLAQLFENSTGPRGHRIRWSIANTMAFGKVSGVEEWAAKVIQDSKYGYSREMLCYAVAKMLPVAEAIPLLISVFDQLPIHATDALGKIAKEQSIIEFLREKQNEYSEILAQKKYRSPLHRNRLKSAVRGNDSAVRKIERRIAGVEEKKKNQTEKQKQQNNKADKKSNRIASFWRRIKHCIKMVETSMNFDGEMVRPFLLRISPLIDSGFDDKEIEEIVICAEDMEVDETEKFRFEIVYAGKPTELRIEVFMDDVDTPDISFYTEQELVEKIEAEMRKYCEELDI